MATLKERYQACTVIHALGDIIGYKDGEWEFNYFKHNREFEDTIEILFEFISLGGINHFSIKGWAISDDTITHLIMGKTLIDVGEKGIPTICKRLRELLIKHKEEILTGFAGIGLAKNIKKLEQGVEWDKMPYYLFDGGSGAAMRSPCIGLAFSGKKNRAKLISVAIETSRVTHNSATGYLGGLTSALFTAYAIEDVPIEQWPFKLMKLLESDTLDYYFKQTRGYKDYARDKDQFINHWKIYIDDNFKDGKAVKEKVTRNLVFRSKYYARFSTHKKVKGNIFVGSAGDDSVIVAYDSLLDAGPNFEKLIVYAMLHSGDTDTTGSIAGAWYGAMYGFKDVPKHLMEHKIIPQTKEMGKIIYDKFSSS